MVVELRLVIAATALLAWMLARDPRLLRVDVRDLPYLLVLGIAGVAAVQGSYYYAIAKLGVGPAILLQYLAPSLIVVWDFVRGVRPRASMIMAVVLALAGTALLVSNMASGVGGATLFDRAIGFASAVIFAFYVMYSKRGLARYAPETLLFYTFVIAAIAWAIVIPPQRILAMHFEPSLWFRFLLLGLFSTLVPFRCFYSGLRRLPAAEAGIIATAEPVVAIIAAGVFLGESLAAIQYVGAVLVIAAAVLATREHPETATGRADAN
jgi:drug/metabolite transporter (DMT)-like permease